MPICFRLWPSHTTLMHAAGHQMRLSKLSYLSHKFHSVSMVLCRSCSVTDRQDFDRLSSGKDCEFHRVFELTGVWVLWRHHVSCFTLVCVSHLQTIIAATQSRSERLLGEVQGHAASQGIPWAALYFRVNAFGIKLSKMQLTTTEILILFTLYGIITVKSMVTSKGKTLNSRQSLPRIFRMTMDIWLTFQCILYILSNNGRNFYTISLIMVYPLWVDIHQHRRQR